MSQPLLAYQIIALADNLCQITCDLIGEIAADLANDPREQACASRLLQRVNHLSMTTADEPDLDRFYARLMPITHEVEAFVNRHRGDDCG